MMIRNENKGFTLIELITVIVVLSILGMFTFSFIDNAIRTYVLVREQSPLYADGTYIMERITRELSDAKTVETAASSTLTFTTPVHPPPPLPVVRPATQVTFRQEGRDLFRISNGNKIIIGRNINKFNVGPADYGTITVELELNSPSDPSIPPFLLRTTVLPNNYQGASYGENGRSFEGNYYETIQ